LLLCFSWDRVSLLPLPPECWCYLPAYMTTLSLSCWIRFSDVCLERVSCLHL
jgi:hypothetical protein